MPKTYWVYILSNQSRTLYIGMTSDLEKRMAQHKSKSIPGFTKRYNITELVYVESTNDVREAIAREKQLKGWRRERKIELIETLNPAWIDLSKVTSEALLDQATAKDSSRLRRSE